MMFIHGIDDNLLNSCALVFRVYEQESKMQNLWQDINKFWESKPNQNNRQNSGLRFSVNIGILFYHTTAFLKR